MDPRPLFLFTDFGWAGPYVGQLHAAVLAVDQRLRVIDLMHDAPAMRPDLAAPLLPRVCRDLPRFAMVAAIVDPGVGGERDALIVETPSTVFVGPDNGLFSCLTDVQRVSLLKWRPPVMSVCFHGRDLFVPAAARIALGEEVESTRIDTAAWQLRRPDSRAECVVYIDGFGNLMTGIPAERLSAERRLQVGPHIVEYAETFCKSTKNQPFWYRNSLDLAEIALAGGSASALLRVALGDRVLIH